MKLIPSEDIVRVSTTGEIQDSKGGGFAIDARTEKAIPTARREKCFGQSEEENLEKSA